MPTKVSAQPDSEPLTLAEVKNHLKVDFDTDDAMINVLIQAAREAAEDYTNQKLVTQTIEETFTCFETALRLTFSPLVSISSIYYKVLGVSTLLDAGEYESHSYQKPAVITPDYNKSWPAVDTNEEAVKVTYVVGFGTAANVPAGIKAAMLLMLAHWYENRTDTVRKMPTQSQWLLNRFRIVVF